jgi:hypothetical protein
MKLEMKPRKINSINYSFFITLPLDWLKTHSIGKGDAVYITLNEDGSLSLNPKIIERCEDGIEKTTETA